MTTPIAEDVLKHISREAEEAILCVVEDTLDRPVRTVTPMVIKVTEDDNAEQIITVLRFEARIE